MISFFHYNLCATKDIFLNGLAYQRVLVWWKSTNDLKMLPYVNDRKLSRVFALRK